MKPHAATRIHWSTASFAAAPDTSPMELDGLGQHLQQCRRGLSRWFHLRSGLNALHRSLSARFVTSRGLMALLVGATALVW